ncbi:MAG: TonB C-terminal domain-containing protein [Sulfuricurvum sp.]|nr:TonB C-terminal domain-containing protein [Sulfuricurvum sp.]
MNLHYQRYFLQSGMITFFLIGLMCLFFMSDVLHSSKPDTFAMKKSDVISVSLEDTPARVSEGISPSAPVVQKPVKEVEKISVALNPVKEIVPAIDDLFATVKTAKSKPKPLDNSKQVSELNALEEKILTTKRDTKFFDKVKTLELAKSGVKMVSSSTGPVVNEYNAKIQGIIYANFHPASGTEGFAARVRILLSPNGKLLSYRVISYSGNAAFNAEVDWLKERLRQVGLPQHPQGEEAVFEIILTAKE